MQARHMLLAIVNMIKPWLPLSKSITADNGTEFACFKQLIEETQLDFYFAYPNSPQERGTNENANGLLRQFIPNGFHFKDLNEQILAQPTELINNRPRKCLGFLSPAEAMQRELLKIGA